MQKYWAQFTPEERAKEMKRRAKVSTRKGGKGPPFFAKKSKESKGHPSDVYREVYYQRAQAKKKGLALPPLPKRAPMSLAQKREKDRLRKQRKRDVAKTAVERALRGMKSKPSSPGAGTNRKLLSKKERAAKQRIYQARSTAKTKGLPMPDLPPQIGATIQ
jgi:hypothetical protein